MKTLIGLTAAVLLVAVVLTLYLSGPRHKASGPRCQTNLDQRLYVAVCAADKDPRVAWRVVERTNAWERIKGAITGNP